MLAYVGTDYGKLPHPTYYQLERVWRLADRVPGLPSGYVGLWLWALIAALVVAGGTWVGLRWRGRPFSDRALGLCVAWTATAVVLALGYYTWNNWP